MFSSVFFIPLAPLKRGRLVHHLYSTCEWGGIHCVSTDPPPRSPLFKGVGGMQREDIMYTGVLHIFSEGVSQMSGAYSVVLEVVSVLEVHKPASTLMARVFTAGALYSFFFISV